MGMVDVFQLMLEWVVKAEDKMDGLGMVASETDAVKQQIEQLKVAVKNFIAT